MQEILVKCLKKTFHGVHKGSELKTLYVLMQIKELNFFLATKILIFKEFYIKAK